MTSRDGFACLKGLARWKTHWALEVAHHALAPDEDVEAVIAARAVVAAIGEPRVVGSAFIAEGRRERRMMRETLSREEHTKRRGGVVALDEAMRFRREVRRGEVHPPIQRVLARGDGSGVRRPHARSAPRRVQHLRGVPLGCAQHFLRGARKTKASQQTEVGSRQRRKKSLGGPETGHEGHLLKPLKHRVTWTAGGEGVGLGRHVAMTQPRVVVRGPDETVEVHGLASAIQSRRFGPMMRGALRS